VSVAQAETYFHEIQAGKFIENYTKIMISIDGMHLHSNNVDFLRNVYKIFPKSTPGDPFFSKRCLVYKLQLNKSNMKEKEILMDEEESKFMWYDKGTFNLHSINLREIVDVETGFNETFIKYLEHPKFCDFLQDEKLCLSVLTEKRSYDFYGINEKEIELWFDRLKTIAEENKNKLQSPFPAIEPSLYEPCYDG
jgi:hypothetical protein